MARAKICGITRAADRDAAVRAGADALGFISEVPVETPRELPPERARDLAAGAPPFATTVLVSMPDSAERAIELARTVRPDALQLHGALGADELARIREETATKVVPVVSPDDPERARAVDGAADAVLVDSPSESGAGGTGRTHDWERTRALAADLDSPVILAGGLTPANVADAVDAVDPDAVDVASGVERAGGEKDHGEVAAFVRAAGRSLDRNDGADDGEGTLSDGTEVDA